MRFVYFQTISAYYANVNLNGFWFHGTSYNLLRILWAENLDFVASKTSTAIKFPCWCSLFLDNSLLSPKTEAYECITSFPCPFLLIDNNFGSVAFFVHRVYRYLHFIPCCHIYLLFTFFILYALKSTTIVIIFFCFFLCGIVKVVNGRWLWYWWQSVTCVPTPIIDYVFLVCEQVCMTISTRENHTHTPPDRQSAELACVCAFFCLLFRFTFHWIPYYGWTE